MKINKEYISIKELEQRFEIAIQSSCTQSVMFSIDNELEVKDDLSYGDENIEDTMAIYIYDNVKQTTYKFEGDRINAPDHVLIKVFIDEILDKLGLKLPDYQCPSCHFISTPSDFSMETVDLEGRPHTDYNCPECYYECETLEQFRRK